VVNDGKREALQAAGIARAWACEHGVPCTDLDAWEDLGGSAEITDRQIAASAGDPDLIVTIGGPIAGARPCGLLARPWIGEPVRPGRSQWGVCMAEVMNRLVSAVNAHDLDASAALFDADYRSSQPAHPGRTFTGREQMRANWAAMFAGIPDFRAELVRSVDDGQITWSEWHWSGTRTGGQAFEMRGVTLFEIVDDVIVAGRLYLEDVERDLIGIDEVVETLSGHRPHTAGP
jgi:hypothetical protein